MKKQSVLHKITAALLCCTLCCSGMAVTAISAEKTEELPPRFDWRDADPPILTPVKIQYGGTCWAYGPMGCIEADMVKKGFADSSLDLSETHLIWFINGQGSPTDPDDPCYGGGPEYGVEGYKSGGNTYRVFAALAAWQGVVYENDYPAHSASQPLNESERYRSVAHFQNGEVYSFSDRDHIKKMIMEKDRCAGRIFKAVKRLSQRKVDIIILITKAVRQIMGDCMSSRSWVGMIISRRSILIRKHPQTEHGSYGTVTVKNIRTQIMVISI